MARPGFCGSARPAAAPRRAVVVMALMRRARPTRRAQVAMCAHAYKPLDGRGGLSARTSSSIRTSSRWDGIEEHNDYGGGLIEATREIRRACRCPRSGGGVATVVFVSRQRAWCGRPCTRRSLPRHPAPAWTWASSMRGSSRCTTTFEPGLWEGARTSCSTAAPTPPCGCHHRGSLAAAPGEA